MFKSAQAKNVIRNTIGLSFFKLIIGTPIPILFALLLNEIGSKRYMKVVQTVSYLPHFLSWIIVVGLFQQVLSVDGGIFNVGNGTWQIVGLVAALAIMAMGIGGGIEKANKIMMPLLFGLFLILGVYLEPEYRGCGIGGSYFEFVKSEFGGKVKRIRLEVGPENVGAIRLYERNGFDFLDYRQMIIDY